MQKALVALMMSVVALSGCVSDADDTPTDPGELYAGFPADFVNPLVHDHDHEDAVLHDVANNIEMTGYNPIREGAINTISEIDMAGGFAYVAEMGFGFHIFDLADPENPVLVSSTDITSPDDASPLGLYMADLKVDATGDWVFVATELSTTPGVLIYDARDKTAPVLAGFWPEPGLLLGCHMIEYAIIEEQEYLFCAPLDNAVYVGMLLDPVGPAREVVQVARWMPTSEKFVAQQGAVIEEQAAEGDPAGAALHFVSGHQDMTYQLDPLTGTHMLSVSFWNLGLRWVDVSNPALPMEVGSWQGEDSDHWAGNIHTAMMFADEERRIAVAIPEGAQPPTVFVFDATDFDNPELLGEWTPKDEHGNHSRFSMHNFQIVDGKVYLTMYHGGVWILDVSNEENQADPKVIGTYMPFDRRPEHYGRGLNGGIMSWDVTIHNGYMLTANTGGFYTLALEGDPHGDDQYFSFA